jgi:hypothetical protein
MTKKLITIRTDAEYIQAFRESNNPLINEYIRKNMDKFLAVIKKSFSAFSDDTLHDIFSDTITRMWENTQSGKLTEEKLTSTLFSYMLGVGIMVAHEHMRSEKKIVRSELLTNAGDAIADEFAEEEQTNQSFRYSSFSAKQAWDEAGWIDVVENPYVKYVQYGHSERECMEEWTRLAEAYEKSQKSKTAPTAASSEKDYRTIIIKDIVDHMGKPCAPLLNLFYWEKKSWTMIADELEYSGADSAKTQKNKCMGKLKSLVINRLKSVVL